MKKKRPGIQAAPTPPANKITKTWDQMTRQEKRNVKLRIPGRGQMKVIDYIRSLAKTLPVSRTKDTKQIISHDEQLRIVYMEKGVDGINEYVKMYSEILEEQLQGLAKENAAELAKLQTENTGSNG